MSFDIYNCSLNTILNQSTLKSNRYKISYINMNFIDHIAHLSERSKPPSDIKIKNLLPHAIDMYRWKPAMAIFTKVCVYNYLFEDGTVIVYFKNSMLAIQVPPDAFDGEFLPKTWLNDAFRVHYRCSHTGNILQGCLMIGDKTLL